MPTEQDLALPGAVGTPRPIAEAPSPAPVDPQPLPAPSEEPDPVLEAFRTELRGYIDKPLTPKSLRQILQIAEAARGLLAVRDPRVRRSSRRRNTYGQGMAMSNPTYVGAYDDCDYDEDEEGLGIQSTPGNMNLDRETFGSRMLRELVAVIPHITRMHREDPTQIVQAIATAKKEGMTDLAKELRARLVPDTAASTQGPKSDHDPRKAIWAARLPGSSEYIVGPAPLDVVRSLAAPEHEIVNTETGKVEHRPAEPDAPMMQEAMS
jgi:hypothetical protein